MEHLFVWDANHSSDCCSLFKELIANQELIPTLAFHATEQSIWYIVAKYGKLL